MLVINKYFAATPFYRVENIQRGWSDKTCRFTGCDGCHAMWA